MQNYFTNRGGRAIAPAPPIARPVPPLTEAYPTPEGDLDFPHVEAHSQSFLMPQAYPVGQQQQSRPNLFSGISSSLRRAIQPERQPINILSVPQLEDIFNNLVDVSPLRLQAMNLLARSYDMDRSEYDRQISLQAYNSKTRQITQAVLAHMRRLYPNQPIPDFEASF